MPLPSISLSLSYALSLIRSNLFLLSYFPLGSEPIRQGAKARFQSAVASTSMQHAVTATIRQASLEKQRSISVYAGSPFAPNGSVNGSRGPGARAGGGGSGSSVGGGLAGDSPEVNRQASLRKTSTQPSLGVTLEDEGDR